MRAAVGIFLALVVTGCSPDPDVSGSAGLCAAKLYSAFNPKIMEQCVNACRTWSYEGFWVTQRDQAAWFTGASRTSMPSLNLTPATIFGK
jgi:hypothetical protein